MSDDMKPTNREVESSVFERLKERIFDIVEVARPGDLESKIVDTFIMALIIANIGAVILETVPSIDKAVGKFFDVFEMFSVIVFSIEYIVRVWTCTCNPKYSHPFWGRVRYIFSFMALVDMLAVLPFYLPMLIKVDLRFLRAMRLFRLLRLVKMGRYSNSLAVLGRVLQSRRLELGVTMFTAFVMLTVASSLMYIVEGSAQPDKFTSIPAAMWWGVATLTTVGYGDYYPVTPLGKFLGSVVAVLGIGLFALPAGILGAGFSEEMERIKAQAGSESEPEKTPVYGEHIIENVSCPYCGKKLTLKIIESEENLL